MYESNLTMESVSLTVNQTYLFGFEQEFEHLNVKSWMVQHWTVCFYYVAAYMLIVFGGQQFMQSRPRFELRKALVTWNCMLAIFSIIGTLRTLPEMIHVLRNFGLYHSVCVPSFIENNRISGFWTWAFVMSKVPELIDTIFIVLRKQPLIFLHWYHHATVLIYSWYAFAEYTAPARWFIVMNYIVHAFMYCYYALRAAGYRLPKFIAMMITVSQLAQMVAGCSVNLWAYQLKEGGEHCQVSHQNIKLSLLMYFSYFILFAHFFYRSYFNKSQKKAELLTKEVKKIQ